MLLKVLGRTIILKIITMYTEKEKVVLQKLGEAWNYFVNLLEPDQRNPANRHSKAGVSIVDDDVHDFRKAIHDADRIIQARAMRRVQNTSIDDLTTTLIKIKYPKAENITVVAKFKEKNIDIEDREVALTGSTAAKAQICEDNDPDLYMG